jgi:hypothetical protein
MTALALNCRHQAADPADRFAMLKGRLRQLFPAGDARPFANLLMEIDEAEWQAKIAKISLRWDARC